jgi:beta-xylosidase
LQPGRGLIDPCPLWDDDGKAYLAHAYAHSRSGLKHKLRVCPMTPDATRLLGEGQIVFHEPERQHTIEGPKFLKRDGWYYLFAPAGGVATGWQTVLRSRNIFGPYEDRVVLAQGSTPVNGPHQGALVDTPNGEWWFLHFQDVGVYGRVVHLQPVQWRDGWPLVGTVIGDQLTGEPVLHHRKPHLPEARVAIPATSDEFSSSRLGLQWQWIANHRNDWYSLSERDGWLRLFALPAPGSDLARLPNLLLQKFPAHTFAVEARLSLNPQLAGLEAGLVVLGNQPGALALRATGHDSEIVFRTNSAEHGLGNLSDGEVILRVEVAEGGLSHFSLRTNSGESIAAPQPFQAQAGKWIGAKVGIYCCHRHPSPVRSFADFDYFRFLPAG